MWIAWEPTQVTLLLLFSVSCEEIQRLATALRLPILVQLW